MLIPNINIKHFNEHYHYTIIAIIHASGEDISLTSQTSWCENEAKDFFLFKNFLKPSS